MGLQLFCIKSSNDYKLQKCYNHFTSRKAQHQISISWLFGTLKNLHLHQFILICNCSTYHEYPFCAFVFDIVASSPFSRNIVLEYLTWNEYKNKKSIYAYLFFDYRDSEIVVSIYEPFFRIPKPSDNNWVIKVDFYVLVEQDK